MACSSPLAAADKETVVSARAAGTPLFGWLKGISHPHAISSEQEKIVRYT